MIWVPGHVTAIFYPVRSDDPGLTGSLGAGFSIGVGVFTELIESDRLEVYVNGLKAEGFVSETALRMLLKEKAFKVYHYTEAPLGFGFGMSAACALGATLEAARILGLDLKEASHYAHVAEVIHKTGLGDVISEFYGGFEIRIKPGSPLTGELIRVDPDGRHAALVVIGELETPRVLSDQSLVERIKKAAKRLIEELKPDPNTIVAIGREFAEESGLLEVTGLKPLYRTLSKRYDLVSMIMLSKGLFVLSKDPAELIELKEEFGEHVWLTDVSESRTFIRSTFLAKVLEDFR